MVLPSWFMNRDPESLLDIAKCARLIIEFSRGIKPRDLSENLMIQSALLHQFLVMGEAVKRLSIEFREEHSPIPWAQIAGMRDNLIHDYEDVDLDQVWRAVENDVPQLLEYLEPLLPREE